MALRIEGDPIAANNGLFYLHSDHLGSTSVTLDASGNKIGEMKYTPFGETRSGSAPTDRRFTGQRQEDSSLGSLYDFNARMYSPALGRFLSADTIVPDGRNPQAFNRYAYVNNRTMSNTDPTGHCASNDTACNEALDSVAANFDIKFDERELIWQGFCNVSVGCLKQWETWQVESFRAALSSLRDALGATAFARLVSGVTFRLTDLVDGGEGYGEYIDNDSTHFHGFGLTQGAVIEIDPDAFYEAQETGLTLTGQQNINWTVSHEGLHRIVDVLPDGDRYVQNYTRQFWPEHSFNLIPFLRGFTVTFNWPDGGGPTDYSNGKIAGSDPEEDMGDTFANGIYGHYSMSLGRMRWFRDFISDLR